jgi:dTDP-4-dehydrorhamnose reductase
VKRILLLGGSGMLGTELRAALANRDVIAPSSSDVDLTDGAKVAAFAAGCDVVVNAAAYTDVDGAEADEAGAFAVNRDGARNAATAATAVGARFVHISTDYVFDGAATAPYPEAAALAPRSAYGRSKAEGERAVAEAHARPIIVRTAWLYGRSGRNFARTIASLAGRQPTVSVVTDQRGQPTWARDVAAVIVRLLDARVEGGTFHATSSGEASWFAFAREIFRAVGEDPDRVVPTTTDGRSRAAPRPAYSVLGHDAWATVGIAPLPDWRDSFARAVRAGVLENI